MSGWPIVPLESLAADQPRAITDGPFGSNLARQHYTATGPQVVRLQNIGDGTYIQSPAHISVAHFERLRAHEVLPGDLLVASLGEVLPRACLAPEQLGPAIVKADCIRIRLSGSVDPKWVLYSMQRPQVRRWADEQRHGVGRPRLGLAVIRRIPIPIPPLEEQHRIVAILDEHLTAMNDAIESLASANARCAALWISGLKRVREAAELTGGLISIDELADTTLGKMLDAKRQVGEPTPYLRNINVRWGRVELDDLQLTKLTEDDRARLVLEEGDLLVCEGGEPGRCAVWNEPHTGIAFQKALHRVRIRDRSRLDPNFLAALLEEGIRVGRWDHLLTGTTIKHLPQERLRRLRVPMPPLNSQVSALDELSELHASVDRLASQVELAFRRAHVLRRALLDAAFSARLTGRSSDADLIQDLAGEREADQP